jgi:hypothetical protein
MIANFTSVILENGLVPIAPSIQKRLGLSQGDQVRISIKVLGRPEKHQTADTRYAELLTEKDLRILTPQEQAELIALANAEFDSAIARTKKSLQKNTPELFDAQGRLKKRKALASLSYGKGKIGTRREIKRQSHKAA